MTAVDPAANATPPPAGIKRWWRVVLVASLALNCLMIGAVASRWYTHDRMERFTGASYTQLLPRRFMADLPAERRKELMAVLGGHRKDFSSGRSLVRKAAMSISDALEREPYDPKLVDEAIAAFNGEAFGLFEKGGSVAREVLSRLAPDERKLLAKRLRERATGSGKRN